MSNFHKQKEEAKKHKKIIFSAESLQNWKDQEYAKMKAEIMKDVEEKIEEANARLREKEEYINTKTDEIKQEAYSNSFVLLMGLPLKVLYDHYGFRAKKRLPDFGTYLCDYYHDFVASGMNAEELAEFIKDYVGLGFGIVPEDEQESEDNNERDCSTV